MILVDLIKEKCILEMVHIVLLTAFIVQVSIIIFRFATSTDIKMYKY